jgi:hypothetical protein
MLFRKIMNEGKTFAQANSEYEARLAKIDFELDFI